MLVYAAVMIACLLLLTVAHLGSTRQRKRIVLFSVFALTCFAALRGYVGTDTGAYHSMFSNFSNESLADVLGVVEPIFALLIKAAATFSDDSFVFVVLIALIQGLLLARVATTSNNPLDFLAIYVTIFYLNFHFNIVRAGTAILFLILAMRVPKEDDNQTKFYALGVAAILAHYSAVIGFLPLLLLRQRAAAPRAQFLSALPQGVAHRVHTQDASAGLSVLPVRRHAQHLARLRKGRQRPPHLGAVQYLQVGGPRPTSGEEGTGSE